MSRMKKFLILLVLISSLNYAQNQKLKLVWEENFDSKTLNSDSWNFDIGKKNKIIGIREVYTKLGKGGDIEEVINDIENASCGCKIIKWHKPDNSIRSFYLKNEILDSISSPELKSLIDEKSILLGRPQEGVVLVKDTTINF